MMKPQMTIRKNGKYYQAGYYEKGKWILELQLGTAEKIVELVRAAKDSRTSDLDVPKFTQEVTIENP